MSHIQTRDSKQFSRLPAIVTEAAQIILGGVEVERFWGFSLERFSLAMHAGLCRLVVDPGNTPWEGRIHWTAADDAELESAKSSLDWVPNPAHQCDLQAALKVASNNQIVAISGPIESGKTTAAVALEAVGFKNLAFADPVKVALPMLFGIPIRYFNDHELKKTPLPGTHLTPRAVIQLTATEVCRGFYDQLWCHRFALRAMGLALASAKGAQVRDMRLVAGDLRFQNEADFLRSVGATVLRVSRPSKIAGDSGSVNRNHLSEKGFDDAPDDIHLSNDGSLQQFESAVISAVDRRAFPCDDVRRLSSRPGR